MNFEIALKKSLEAVEVRDKISIVPLEDALGKVVAKDIVCQKNLPSFNNAALDGFAFSYKEGLKTLKIKKTIFAGDNVTPSLGENECYKIMTGAKVPDDADTILAFEDALFFDENEVKMPAKIKKGNAFRFKGEEQKKGSVLIKKGEILSPSSIAMLAAQGITHLPICADLLVVIVSTGDELKEPWEESSEDEIYNCNGYAIKAILESYGFKANYAGVIPDDKDSSREFIGGLKDYDFIITSGGISMGEADFIKDSFTFHGLKEIFHGVNLKPGRPTMVGKIGKSSVISLPGNPMAAYLNTILFAIPALFKALGIEKGVNKKFKALNKKAFKCKGGRTELVLGRYEDGFFHVTRDNRYGSGMLTPLLESNALFISKEDESLIEEEKEIEIILLP